MEKRTNGQHARGTNIIPFSMYNIDEVLGELGLNIRTETSSVRHRLSNPAIRW